jgi:NMD protein affecting ribosome stability and mRNA decay
MGKSSSRNPAATNAAPTARNSSPHPARPRATIQDFDDPYLPDHHLPDDTLCSRCGAIYRTQRWTFDEARRNLLLAATDAHQVVCPACRKVADRDPQGIVTLRGDYWPQHRQEILNLIRHEEERGLRTNPLERIIDMREEDGRLIIETTNEKLAQRIGRCIGRAHRGSLQYKWSQDNRLVRMEWERSINHK